MIVEGICCGYAVDYLGYQYTKQGVEIGDNLKMYCGEMNERHEVGKILEMWVADDGVHFKAEMADEDEFLVSRFYPCAYGRVLEKVGKHIRRFRIDGINVLTKSACCSCRFSKPLPAERANGKG